MEDFTPKQMALMLFKLSLQNSAMLQQTLMMQTENMKMLRIIHAGSNGQFSIEMTNTLEALAESLRQKQADFLNDMLPVFETLSKAKLSEWLSDALDKSDLSGSKSDYSEFAKLVRSEMLHTASE